MTPDPMQPQAQAPQQAATLDVTPVMLACINAIEQVTAKAAGTASAAEAKDFMAAALSGAQVLVQLDPTRLAGGDTPDGRAASVPRQPPTRDGNKNGIIGG